MTNRSHVYFASDFHLGVPDHASSLEREKRIVRWLDSVKHNAAAIYLMGDLFDFWFEHRFTAPKGYVRLLGKIAEITDSGIPVALFTGNHDMWMFGYLEKEIGVTVHKKPLDVTWNGVSFHLAHGDGLGPGDHAYKGIKKVFANRFFQWCYARLHPNLAFGVANYFSRASRKANSEADSRFLGEEKEWLVQYCKATVASKHYDYLIFGHRHLPLEIKIGERSTYINLGDWIKYNTYAVFDGSTVSLRTWKD